MLVADHRQGAAGAPRKREHSGGGDGIAIHADSAVDHPVEVNVVRRGPVAQAHLLKGACDLCLAKRGGQRGTENAAAIRIQDAGLGVAGTAAAGHSHGQGEEGRPGHDERAHAKGLSHPLLLTPGSGAEESRRGAQREAIADLRLPA